jgi:predicted transcriptional regulator
VIDTSRRLLISVRPRFANAILDGSKTVELRRTPPRLAIPTQALIYASSPTMALVGTCNVVRVVSHTPWGLWCKYGKQTGVSYEEYQEYFVGAPVAFGLILTDPIFLDHPVSLRRLRSAWRNFQPPQSFRYVTIPESDQLLSRAS